jgi:hypothetical protein
MSPRMSRLYTWLQANGVALQDFSTDQCVARELPKLERLELALDDARLADPGATVREPTYGGEVRAVRYLDELAADLRNLMRRTPGNRVCASKR